MKKLLPALTLSPTIQYVTLDPFRLRFWVNGTALGLILAVVFLLSSCKKRTEAKDCGCDGNPRATIENSQALVGYLMNSEGFKNDPNSVNQLPEGKYGIFYAPAGCPNCAHSLFICNDELLAGLGNIPPYPGIKVKFAGQLKYLCTPVIAPSDVTYEHIVLTKIERY